MKPHLFAAIGLTFCAALGVPSGCGSGAVEDVAAPGEAMNASFAAHYYTANRVQLPCALAVCRDYLLTEVNGAAPARMARSLDFSSAHLEDNGISDVLAAPPGELVLYGTFGPSTEEGAPFGVRAAFRGMPGIPAPEEQGFYTVKARDPHIECLIAPCNNEIATRLETGETVEFTTLSVEQAARFHVDQAWLADRVLHHGAVVQGHFRNGANFAGGPERVLDAAQVYDPLPDRGGPCLLQLHVCQAGTEPVYARDVNRCLIFQGCVGRRVCPGFRLACEDGYTQVRWATSDPACWAQVCDPTFLAE
jgi:hypothetical protein